MPPSEVARPDLASDGQQKLDWVKRHMPILGAIEQRFRTDRPFAGMRIMACLHLEAKTAYLAQVLAAGGAQVAVTGSNAHSTKDDVVAALADSGLHVYARHAAAAAEMDGHMRQAMALRPNIIIDDGGDIVELAHDDFPEGREDIIGACEETTSGVMRARARAGRGELAFPVMLINDARCKYLFDNYHGTGQSVWDGFMRTTNLSICGRTVVIVGFGWCGRGCAARARGLGARVIVCEVDPVNAMEAVLEGFEVMPLAEAAGAADVLLTVTGGLHAIGEAHLEELKDGTMLANAGHFNTEIDLDALARLAVERRTMRENLEGFRLANGRWVYLFGSGGLINITCADGHPADIMDTSFALQALSARYLADHRGRLPADAIKVPEAIDLEVARLRLAAAGVRIDSLNEAQLAYLESHQGATAHPPDSAVQHRN